jgi:hypothetical protein
MVILDLNDPDGMDPSPIQATFLSLRERLLIDGKDEPIRVVEIDGQTTVPVPGELMASKLGQRPGYSQGGHCLELLEPLHHQLGSPFTMLFHELPKVVAHGFHLGVLEGDMHSVW